MADTVEMTCANCGAAFLARLDRLPRKYCGPVCRRAEKAKRQSAVWRLGRAAFRSPPSQAELGEGAGNV